ncbi:MAG: hypothetical protein JSS65_02580 [Armatimonadetes bacterium]|nr:hypothetical protein [Armatimonadota bacterium]
MTSAAHRPLLVLAGIAVLASSAWPQEATDKQDKTPEKTAETKAEEVPQFDFHTFTVGYASRISKQNRVAMSPYAQTSSGFVFFQGKCILPLEEGRPFSTWYFSGTPNADYATSIRFALPGTTIKVDSSDANYFDQTFGLVDASRDRTLSFSANQKLAAGVDAYVAAETSERNHNYTAPKPNARVDTRQYTAAVTAKVGPGRLDVAATNHTLGTKGDLYPYTERNTFQARYSADFGDSVTLEGAAGYTRINQQGLDASAVRNFGLEGRWDLTPGTFLNFRLRHEDYELANTQNAYVRTRVLTGLNLHTSIAKWSVDAGFDHRESERYREDQSYVDVPKWNDYTLRLSKRLAPGLRFSAKGQWQDLTSTAQAQTTDNRMLMWDDRATGQVKLDYFSGQLASYLTYTHRFQRNSVRDVDVDWNNLSLGASYVFNDKLSAFGEMAVDRFHVTGTVGQNGDFLSDYFSNGNTYSLGFDFRESARNSYSASWNYFQGTDSLGNQLTLHFRRDLGHRQSVDFTLAPWRRFDRLYDVNSYEAALFAIKLTVRP